MTMLCSLWHLLEVQVTIRHDSFTQELMDHWRKTGTETCNYKHVITNNTVNNESISTGCYENTEEIHLIQLEGFKESSRSKLSLK